MQIAIDGPAGSGKSTVARLLAKRLGYLYIDTGAMYRALTLKALRAGLPLDDEGQIANLLTETKLELLPAEETVILLDGEDVSQEIRLPEVNRGVSPVSALGKVRKILVERQREMATADVVMDGRDIGTVVLPEAQVKIFLSASIRERAKRRRLELAHRGVQVTQEEAEVDLAYRDQQDASRAIGPLKQADDAILVDTTELSIEEVVERVLAIVEEAGAQGEE